MGDPCARILLRECLSPLSTVWLGAKAVELQIYGLMVVGTSVLEEPLMIESLILLNSSSLWLGRDL